MPKYNAGAASAKRGQPNDSHSLTPNVAQFPIIVNDATPIAILTVGQLRQLLAENREVEPTATPNDITDMAGICAHFGVSAPTIRSWIDLGMPVIKRGAVRRFSRSDCAAWARTPHNDDGGES